MFNHQELFQKLKVFKILHETKSRVPGLHEYAQFKKQIGHTITRSREMTLNAELTFVLYNFIVQFLSWFTKYFGATSQFDFFSSV